MTQHQANRELIRNLAHEIKNPLGGLRGSAQLLERELDRPELREYTQVIIKEADRLQSLMDRLLTPHRPSIQMPINIHEVCERVRSLILAEFPNGIRVQRDYDASLPDFQADPEQLIQAVLNIARNAAQAILGRRAAKSAGEIVLRTRVARQVTLAKRSHRLALELQVVDNGPGVPGGYPRQDLLSAGVRPRRRQRSGPDAGADLRAASPRGDRMGKPAGPDLLSHRAASAIRACNDIPKTDTREL